MRRKKLNISMSTPLLFAVFLTVFIFISCVVLYVMALPEIGQYLNDSSGRSEVEEDYEEDDYLYLKVVTPGPTTDFRELGPSTAPTGPITQVTYWCHFDEIIGGSEGTPGIPTTTLSLGPFDIDIAGLSQEEIWEAHMRFGETCEAKCKGEAEAAGLLKPSHIFNGCPKFFVKENLVK